MTKEEIAKEASEHLGVTVDPALISDKLADFYNAERKDFHTYFEGEIATGGHAGPLEEAVYDCIRDMCEDHIGPLVGVPRNPRRSMFSNQDGDLVFDLGKMPNMGTGQVTLKREP